MLNQKSALSELSISKALSMLFFKFQACVYSDWGKTNYNPLPSDVVANYDNFFGKIEPINKSIQRNLNSRNFIPDLMMYQTNSIMGTLKIDSDLYKLENCNKFELLNFLNVILEFAKLYKLDKPYTIKTKIYGTESIEAIEKKIRELQQEIYSSQENENSLYYITNGIFYLDARNTGLTISKVFPDIFPNTEYGKDRVFYENICKNCLDIPNIDVINGEYKVDLKFDGNDDTTADNDFGYYMRKHYISEYYEKGVNIDVGREILLKFDEEHGTKICKAENNTYDIAKKVYRELIPEDFNEISNLIKYCSIEFFVLLALILFKPIMLVLNPWLYPLLSSGVKFLFLYHTVKLITHLKNTESYVNNWIYYVKKMHVFDNNFFEKIESGKKIGIDNFDLSSGEIIGFVRALSEVVKKIPKWVEPLNYYNCALLSNKNMSNSKNADDKNTDSSNSKFYLEDLGYYTYKKGLEGGIAYIKNALIGFYEQNIGTEENANRMKNAIDSLKSAFSDSFIGKFILENMSDEDKEKIDAMTDSEKIAEEFKSISQKIINEKVNIEELGDTYLSKLGGFSYAGNEEDYYYTLENSFQSKLGFMDFYDKCDSLLGMKGLQDLVVTFPYDDKEYRVELWYGPYGGGRSYGAEIGIYYRSLSDAMEKPYDDKSYSDTDIITKDFILYDCVKDKKDKSKNDRNYGKSDQFVMTMVMYRDDIKQYDHTTEGHSRVDDPTDNDHFWCLAIRSSELGPDQHKIREDAPGKTIIEQNRKTLKIEATIQNTDQPDLMKVMYKALKNANFKNNSIEVEHKSAQSKINLTFGGIYETDRS